MTSTCRHVRGCGSRLRSEGGPEGGEVPLDLPVALEAEKVGDEGVHGDGDLVREVVRDVLGDLGIGEGVEEGLIPVSYTHLTLPTKA